MFVYGEFEYQFNLRPILVYVAPNCVDGPAGCVEPRLCPRAYKSVLKQRETVKPYFCERETLKAFPRDTYQRGRVTLIGLPARHFRFAYFRGFRAFWCRRDTYWLVHKTLTSFARDTYLFCTEVRLTILRWFRALLTQVSLPGVRTGDAGSRITAAELPPVFEPCWFARPWNEVLLGRRGSRLFFAE